VRGASVAEFLEGFPAILGAQNLRELAQAIARARDSAKPVLWGFGGHVIKTGLAPIFIDLMDRGLVSGIALNGSGIIHDFEIALAGSTSEDVDAELSSGNFGMAEETGQQVNQAISEGVAAGLGIGEALGQYLARIHPEHSRYSLILQAWLRSIPVTVHVTIGADIIHNHAAFSPSDVGEGTHRDFRILASLVASLNEGGVYVNCGSAVTLPEVFLKCITLVRNSGDPLCNFTTANLDFIQHYRPTVNVVKRPVQSGGRGIAITGHHEILIPLLAAWLVELSPRTRTDD
jgi:deoxyhypusine synthase